MITTTTVKKIIAIGYDAKNRNYLTAHVSGVDQEFA